MVLGRRSEGWRKKEKRSVPTQEIPRRKGGVDTKTQKELSLPKKRAPEKPRQKPDVTKSLLQNEERAFPRGGASVLTAFEKKQVQAQATQDALFEESGHPPRDLDYYNEEQERGQDATMPARSSKSTRKRQSRVAGASNEIPGHETKIESFRMKRVQPGCMVLGRISTLGVNELCLDLPNHCVGYVPLTNISSPITHSIQNLMNGEEGEEKIAEGLEKEKEAEEDLQLSEYFEIGQYLRACVTSTSRESRSGSEESKKRLELSIRPDDTNRGIKLSDLRQNMMLQASVESVEDHGAVMHLGLENTVVKGFMSNKDTMRDGDKKRLEEGSVFLCCVKSVGSNGRTVKLSANIALKTAPGKSDLLRDAANVKCLLPGVAVDVSVAEITPFGFTGKIMGLVNASSDLVHSGYAAKDLAPHDVPKVGR